MSEGLSPGQKIGFGLLALAVLMTVAAFLILVFSGRSAYQDEPWLIATGARIPVEYQPVDAVMAGWLAGRLDPLQESVERFFGQPFPQSLTLTLLPDRGSLNRHWRAQWGQTWFISTCWMVGSGGASNLSLLSPRAWDEDACGHDPGDARHIEQLLVHELVHSYHDQVFPGPDLGLVEDLDWFIEGLAIFAAGQLDQKRVNSVRDLVAASDAPQQLRDAWSGDERYGVCGSLVAYIDQRYGRALLVTLLHLDSTAELLQRLQVNESELLAGWRRQLLAASGSYSSS